MSNPPKIVITGATSGIARLAAIALARRGAHLILTARSPTKASETRAAIAAAAPGTVVDVHYADFTDLRSVAAAGDAIAAQYGQLDLLINNAGLHAFQQRVTADGFSEMVAVNYLAPWILTQKLRGALLAAPSSRIVTVASEAARQSNGLNPATDLFDTRPFTARGSSSIYARTKLMNIMFSLELARQMQGTGVAVNCLDPGFNVTGLGRELGFATPLAHVLNWLGIGNPARGAGLIVKLATDPVFQARSGQYVTGRDAHSITPIAPGDDQAARIALWSLTAATIEQVLEGSRPMAV